MNRWRNYERTGTEVEKMLSYLGTGSNWDETWKKHEIDDHFKIPSFAPSYNDRFAMRKFLQIFKNPWKSSI